MKKLFITAVSIGVISSSLLIQSANAADAPIYVVSKSDGATLSVIATTGDRISNQVLRGTPDGMGALKNADGTLTLLSNHEISLSSPVAQAGKTPSGTWGSSISKMTYDPKTEKITKVENLIKEMSYFNYTTKTWGPSWDQSVPVGTPAVDSYGGDIGTNGLNRFCSGNLAAAGLLSYTEKDAKTKKSVTYGYTDPVYFTGEEGGDYSRAFAFDLKGNGMQLPGFGLAGWENFLTKPGTGKSTVIMGNEDNNATDSQLYMYVGTKQATGANFAEKAGLTNGKLYTIALEGFRSDKALRASKKVGDKLKVAFNEVNTNPDFGNFTAMAQANGTTFSRIEDGEFDPKNPNIYYFITTESNKDPLATAPNPATPTISRDGGAVWKMTFADAKDPFKGATIEMLLNGTEAPYLSKPDNLTVDENGYLLIQEDPGANDHVARVIAYRFSDGKLGVVAAFDDQYFAKGGANFITNDEETSGIINVNQFLKAAGDNKSYFFLNAQVHAKLSASYPALVANLGAAEVTTLDNHAVEGGQYYKLVIDWTKVTFA
jgi:hypothetical protein